MSEELMRKLKEVRAALGLTQEEMAARLGIPTRTLISWENDQRTPRGFALAQLNGLLDGLVKKKGRK